MAPMVNSYCGCFKLRTGCLIIGYIGAISTFFCASFPVVVLSLLGTREYDRLEEYRPTILGIGVAALFVIALYFALYVTFLVGVHERKPALVKFFVKILIITTVISFILTIALCIFQFWLGLRCLISCFWTVYNILVIKSYYIELKEQKRLENEKPVCTVEKF